MKIQLIDSEAKPDNQKLNHFHINVHQKYSYGIRFRNDKKGIY